MVVDGVSVIRYWNDGAAALTGHRIVGAIGRHLDRGRRRAVLMEATVDDLPLFDL
ncbi:MAG: hypothetical protein ACYC1D_13120 [Acidimicrobiales bacterium]